MKKYILLLFICTIQNSLFAGSDLNSILSQLDLAIKEKQVYVQQKDQRIEGIKKMITADTQPLQEYIFNQRLYQEYRKFKSDSAIHYVNKNLSIAKQQNRPDLFNTALLQLVTLYSSTGWYREAEKILSNIERNTLTEALLPLYYESYRDFFDHYAVNNHGAYAHIIEQYRDSLLSVLDPSSIKYKINSAQKDIYLNRIEEAEQNLSLLLLSVGEDTPDYAMISYLLGSIYLRKGDLQQQKKYLALSAIADIKSSIKDNASIQNLSLIYYNEGNIDRAYKYTQSAIEDAVFCNVQFRTIQMSEFYTIINAAYLSKEAKRKSQLQLYLTLISILSLFLILAVVYVYKQMKKVSNIKEELSKTNKKLIELNNDISFTNQQLKERNEQLSESNIIKEEYIAHFFDLCSTYINKLEDYRKSLNKKANSRQLDELFGMLRSTTVVENEVEELYRIFDTIFLKLYPTFVEDFNALLVKEEQVILKPGELLNTELRIFALIRLGITDSVKIAAFLRYSLSTIYNYRTKARNKAITSRDEFEKVLMKIGNGPA